MATHVRHLVLVCAMAVLVSVGCKGDGKEEAAKSESPTATSAPAASAPEDECLRTGDTPTCLELIKDVEDIGSLLARAAEACNSGNANGCHLAAILVQSGISEPEDMGKAASFEQRACEGGHGGACYELALLYFEGVGVPKDGDKFAEFIRKACEAKDGRGCAIIGRALLKKTDPGAQSAGLDYLKRACELGDEDTCQELAAVPEKTPVPTAPVDRRPVVTRAHGIEWVMDGALAPYLAIKKVTCEPKSGYAICSIIVTSETGYAVDYSVRIKAYDADGVGLADIPNPELLQEFAPGEARKLKKMINDDVASVVIGR